MEHDDLEALFEATRAEAERAAAAAAVVPEAHGDGHFPDTVVAGGERGACPHAGPDGECADCGCADARVLRERVGRLTRELHQSLNELTLDRTLADMAVEIPDARNRLKYVTEMCERSAQKVLDTLDELGPLQQATRDDSAALLASWTRLLDERRRPDEGFVALFERTRAHLASTVERADRTSGLHSEIMMAQDFQDLTGQVCRKIEAITERIEAQLLKLLIDTAPQDDRQRHQERLEGPQVTAGRTDAVASQAEVDDLLSSLGF